jgi:hypothetical protein
MVMRQGRKPEAASEAEKQKDRIREYLKKSAQKVRVTVAISLRKDHRVPSGLNDKLWVLPASKKQQSRAASKPASRLDSKQVRSVERW